LPTQPVLPKIIIFIANGYVVEKNMGDLEEEGIESDRPKKSK